LLEDYSDYSSGRSGSIFYVKEFDFLQAHGKGLRNSQGKESGTSLQQALKDVSKLRRKGQNRIENVGEMCRILNGA